MDKIIVTTADLKQDYEVIGPVYFHISNKGFFTSRLSQLIDEYEEELKEMHTKDTDQNFDWRLLYGNYAFDTDSRFEKAFYVSIREIQKIAQKLNGHAIVGMRPDVKLDQETFQYFYLQLYGTVVRFPNKD